MTPDDQLSIKILKHINYLYAFLEPHEREAFDQAYAIALITGKHFIDDYREELVSIPSPPAEVINILIEWWYSPQGESYWGALYDAINERRPTMFKVKSRKEIAQYLIDTNYKDNFDFSTDTNGEVTGVLALDGLHATEEEAGTFRVVDNDGKVWHLPPELVEEC